VAASLGRIVTGFVYVNRLDVPWNGSICKVKARAESFMGEPTFAIELPNGETRIAIGAQLQPWYRVTDTDDDWLAHTE